MSLLAELFPSAFPALALAHFVALLSPGPDFFLLVGYAVRYRMRGSAGLCVGIAIGNGLYILLAIIGWGILRQLPLLFTVIELLGALYLLWIGSLLIRSQPANPDRSRRPVYLSRIWQTAAAGIRFVVAQPKKCAVLSGANDRPARPVGDAAATNHERDLDDQRGVVLGSADRDVHRLTADPAAVNPRDIVDSAYRWRRVDHLRQCDCAALSAERHFLISVTIFCK